MSANTSDSLPSPAGLLGEVSRADGRTGRKRQRTLSARARRQTVLVTIALVVAALVMLSPMLWTLMSATKPLRVAFASPPQFTYAPTFDAFTNLWQRTDFYRYTLNSVVIGAMAVGATLLLAAPAAYALSRYGRVASAAILAVALLFRAVPGFAIMLPFYDLATRIGVYDTRVGLALAFVGVDLPFTVWLLRNFFAAIPSELDEAAMIDGCSRWGAFRRVILPVMGPGLVTASMLTFLLAFQSYLLPVVLTDVEAQTVPVFLATQVGQSLPKLQQAAAGIVLLTIPILILAVAAQRYLVAGLTSGSVKS